jgi:hypothetical protein
LQKLLSGFIRGLDVPWLHTGNQQHITGTKKQAAGPDQRHRPGDDRAIQGKYESRVLEGTYQAASSGERNHKRSQEYNRVARWSLLSFILGINTYCKRN